MVSPDTTPLDSFSAAVAAVVRQVSPAVVGVHRLRRRGRNPSPEGGGSGAIFAPDGYLLTNSHVVHDAPRLTVRMLDGTEHAGELVGEDPDTDLAVVRIAADGLEGLQMALDLQPDLILMDLDLPGMKGLELCQRLHSSPHLAQVPIVIASATSNPAYFSSSKQLGAAGFVPKPFKTQRLLSYVRMLVAR